MIHLAHPSTLWLITTSITALFAILYPLVLVEVLRRRLGAGWKYAAFGALIFFVFQVVTRIPLVALITPRVTPLLKSSLLASVIWLLVLAITAGMFEEIGRYVGYRVLMRREQKTWEKAVLYGVGHGGLESILLVGLSLIGTLISFFVLSSINLANLPVARRAPLLQQYAAQAAQPGWLPLLGLWERLWTLPVHIALSVIVLAGLPTRAVSLALVGGAGSRAGGLQHGGYPASIQGASHCCLAGIGSRGVHVWCDCALGDMGAAACRAVAG